MHIDLMHDKISIKLCKINNSILKIIQIFIIKMGESKIISFNFQQYFYSIKSIAAHKKQKRQTILLSFVFVSHTKIKWHKYCRKTAERPIYSERVFVFSCVPRRLYARKIPNPIIPNTTIPIPTIRNIATLN